MGKAHKGLEGRKVKNRVKPVSLTWITQEIFFNRLG